MVKKIHLPVFLILIIVAGCRHSRHNSASIEGNLADASGIKLTLLEMDTKAMQPIDSVVPGKGGSLTFSPVVSESGFFLLRAPSGKIMVLLLNPGDQVELTGSVQDFPDHVILKAPREAMLLNDFFRSTRGSEKEVDSLESLLIDRQDSADYYALTQNVDKRFQLILERQRSLESAFITKNPGSLASLVVLNYAFGLNPVLLPDKDFLYYQKVDSALMAKMPGNKHVKFHHQRVLELGQNVKAHK